MEHEWNMNATNVINPIIFIVSIIHSQEGLIFTVDVKSSNARVPRIVEEGLYPMINHTPLVASNYIVVAIGDGQKLLLS